MIDFDFLARLTVGEDRRLGVHTPEVALEESETYADSAWWGGGLRQRSAFPSNKSLTHTSPHWKKIMHLKFWQKLGRLPGHPNCNDQFCPEYYCLQARIGFQSTWREPHPTSAAKPWGATTPWATASQGAFPFLCLPTAELWTRHPAWIRLFEVIFDIL